MPGFIKSVINTLFNQDQTASGSKRDRKSSRRSSTSSRHSKPRRKPKSKSKTNTNTNANTTSAASSSEKKLSLLYSHASLKGRRAENEDTHAIFEAQDGALNVFSIHDGHGGSLVSRFLKNNIVKQFSRPNIKLPLTNEQICKSFNRLHRRLKRNHEKSAMETGSTCLTAFIHKNILKVANTGDCRAIIGKETRAYQITEDHKPGRKDEKNRITKMGGEVKIERGDDFRVGDLSVSRAFGDYSNKYVVHDPDVFTWKITSGDRFMVLGCDGLYDNLKNSQIVEFVNKYVKKVNKKNVRGIASKLANFAIDSGSTDNVSVIVVFFNHH